MVPPSPIAPADPAASLAMLRHAVDHAGDAVEIVDADYRLLYVNPAFELLHGRSSAEVLGRTPKACGLLDPRRAAVYAQSELTIARTGRWRARVDAVHANGTLIPVELNARCIRGEKSEIVGYIGIKRDLRPERATLAKIEARDRRFAEMLERAPVGVLVHVDGFVRYTNPAMASLVGRPVSELVDVHVLDLVHPEDHGLVRDRIARITEQTRVHPREARQPVGVVEMRFGGRDGQVRHARVHPVGWVDFRGEEAFYVMVLDVTAEHERRARSVLADRLQTIGQVAAGVAHEINNPLTWMLDHLDQVGGALERASAPEDSRELLSQARLGAERIQAIVRDLALFTRGSDQELGTVDLGATIDAAVNLGRREIERVAALVLQPPEEEVWVCGSAPRLGQVALNLLLNAARAIPAGGGGRATVRWGRTGDRAWFEVQDNGVGMSQAVRSQAFEPFFTTHARRGGTGLGLAIARDIVSGVGGQIAIASVLGEGTTVRVDLPACEAPPRSREPAPRDVTRQGLVLIVEDQALVARAIARRLQTMGLRVLRADDGREALRLLREHGETIDYVLCDLMMPGIDGMAVWRVLADPPTRLPQRFVFMTGGAFTREAREFLEACEQPVLVKPFDDRHLTEALAWVDERSAPTAAP